MFSVYDVDVFVCVLLQSRKKATLRYARERSFPLTNFLFCYRLMKRMQFIISFWKMLSIFRPEIEIRAKTIKTMEK